MPRLAASVISPLRFAMTSPPSGCQRDFHPRAVEHARHTKKKDRVVQRDPFRFTLSGVTPFGVNDRGASRRPRPWWPLRGARRLLPSGARCAGTRAQERTAITKRLKAILTPVLLVYARKHGNAECGEQTANTHWKRNPVSAFPRIFAYIIEKNLSPCKMKDLAAHSARKRRSKDCLLTRGFRHPLCFPILAFWPLVPLPSRPSERTCAVSCDRSRIAYERAQAVLTMPFETVWRSFHARNRHRRGVEELKKVG
jgi:hypothetical protein